MEYEVKPSGQTIPTEIDWGDPASIPQIMDWEIDSPDVIATAEANRGSDFWREYPDVKIGFLLTMFPLTGPEKQPRWSVEYYSESADSSRVCIINAKDGSLIGWEEWGY